MLKVFLVEDESVVREGLRDNIPWQDYGFTFAGEAGDGEMALPLIRKTQPDVLITDIRMPFMDGLSLCHIVRQEFPNIKIIIMSGFDDFEYAKRAVNEGVDQYLSKPVTRRMMKQALEDIREKIDSEREQLGYASRYQLESREYEQLQRRNFLENVFGGRLCVEEIYEGAGRLNLQIDASCFNLILYSVGGTPDEEKEGGPADQIEETLAAYFLRFPQYILSRWSLNTFCVIVKGEREEVGEYTRRGLQEITRVCGGEESREVWYAAAGKPVERFSALRDCYNEMNHAFACRFWIPKQHILTSETAAHYREETDEGSLESLDVSQVDPVIISSFLENGQKDETEEFTTGYLSTLQDVLKSKMFRGYLMLSIRFNVISFVKKFGVSQEEFLRSLPGEIRDFDINTGEMYSYVERLLLAALDIRDKASNDRSSRLLKDALSYINQHYTDEQLSLNTVAEAVGVSGSYFSASFSREMNMTFVEYITRKRMDRAKELLQTRGMHTQEVAAAVGYKDPHYFSFVFKKTQGISPKEYRNS